METSDLTIEEFKSNLELIEHRGPDDQQHVRDTLGNDFGFCRLSIMDLSAVSYTHLTLPTSDLV